MQGKNPGHGFYIRLRIQSGKRGIASENHDFEESFITESWSDTVEIIFIKYIQKTEIIQKAQLNRRSHQE